MLKFEPHRAEVQPTCFTAQFQRGQSRDIDVVISHVLITFCAWLKAYLAIIVLVYGGVQKWHLVNSTGTRLFFLMTLFF